MQKLMIVVFFGLATASLSVDKCKEYYKKPSVGQPSLINEFPHMGLLGFTEDKDIRYSCPVTLISESFAITPAFCLTRENPTHVLLGTMNSKDKGDHWKLLNVVETIIHPGYSKADKSQINCIGLVKITPSIVFDDNIRPGCLYTKNIDDNQQLVDVLWGRSPGNSTLFKIDSSVVPISTCKRNYEKKVTINEQSHLCVERKFPGDYEPHIGGTSHVFEDGIPKIAAIDNFGPKVPSPLYPDVTTKIYGYIDWIEKNVWKQ